MFPPGFSGRDADVHLPRTDFDSLKHSNNIQELNQQIARLNLLIQTLTRILIAKGVVSEDELQEWMKYVDSLDGRMDGGLREQKSPRTCEQCGRVNSPRAGRCQYCGGDLPAVFLHPDPNEEKR